MDKNTLFLSASDQYVPEDYVGITELLSKPEWALPGYGEEQWCMGIDAIAEMRKKTFTEVKKRFTIARADKFDRFWNCNLDAINSLGLNEFTKLTCLSEICTAMICFQSRVRNISNNRKKKVVSFGIKKSIYEKYRESLREAIQTGKMPRRVSLYDCHKKRNNSLFEAESARISFQGKAPGEYHETLLEKNAIYLRFEQWCKLKDISKQNAIYQALNLLMEKNPAENLDDLKAFGRKTDIETAEVVLQLCGPEGALVRARLPESLANTMFTIIRRYNNDPENSIKSPLTESSFIVQAVAAFVKRIPLKYSDPAAYREYLEIKEAQQYNESVMNRGDGNAQR